MMNRTEVKDKVIETITRELHTNVEIKEESEFRKDLKTDSLDEVEIVMAVEEEFARDFPDTELENCKTVKEFIDLVYKYTEEQK